MRKIFLYKWGFNPGTGILDVAKRLQIENFVASIGWLIRFQNRYGIQYRAICGENKDVPESAEIWKREILTKIAHFPYFSTRKIEKMSGFSENFLRLKWYFFRQENQKFGSTVIFYIAPYGSV